MHRFWPSLAALCALSGCTGQTLEGRWSGPMPYADAGDCRIRLYAEGRFDVACAKDAWLGQGKWTHDGARLRLEYSALARLGRVVEQPAPLEYEYEGRGNELVLRHLGTEYRWTRAMGTR